MKFLENEVVVSTSDDRTMTLTNIRLRHIEKKNGTSILLEHIQSVSMQYNNNIALMFLGILSIILSFLGFRDQPQVQMAGIIAGGLLIGYYIYSRRYYLTIASGGESMRLLLKDQNATTIIQFMDLLEETICSRKKELMAEQHI